MCVDNLVGIFKSAAVACISPYGVIQPVWVNEWGKDSVDWKEKMAKRWASSKSFSLLRELHANDGDPSNLKCPTRDSVVGEEQNQRMALTSAAVNADKSFVMFELGGGSCRWSIDAYKFLELNRPNVHRVIICVEADPFTAEIGRRTLALNEVPPESVIFLEAAVATFDGSIEISRKNNAISYGGGYGQHPGETGKSSVPTISLVTMIQQFWMVDHVDVDCNGCEEQLFHHHDSMKMLTERVKTIFIETHTPEKHEVVRKALEEWGWLTSCPVIVPYSEAEGFFWCKNPHHLEM